MICELCKKVREHINKGHYYAASHWTKSHYPDANLSFEEYKKNLPKKDGIYITYNSYKKEYTLSKYTVDGPWEVADHSHIGDVVTHWAELIPPKEIKNDKLD